MKIEGTSLSSEELLTLLDKLKGVTLKAKEKNIFSIGGRGHYENPVSDVLAFFLDPNEEHELGALVAQAMLECAGISASPHSIQAIHREYRTDEQARLDLVLVGDDWLLAIENKVYHTANNPFEHYEEFLKKAFPKQKKQVGLILLSPKNDKAEGWQPVSFTGLAQAIQANMAEKVLELSFNKWHFFLRDFLANLKTLSGADAMDDTTFDLLEKSMNDIYRLEEAKEAFSEEVKQRGVKLLAEQTGKEFKVKIQEKWGKQTPAYRFSCNTWQGQNDIVLVLDFSEGQCHKLCIYIESQKSDQLSEVLKSTKYDDYKNWFELKETWDCYEINTCYSSITEGLEHLSKLAKLVDDWHTANALIIAD